MQGSQQPVLPLCQQELKALRISKEITRTLLSQEQSRLSARKCKRTVGRLNITNVFYEDASKYNLASKNMKQKIIPLLFFELSQFNKYCF